MLKYLRIAVTALSLTACVLLIALWVRSYWRCDQIDIPVSSNYGISIESVRGQLAGWDWDNLGGPWEVWSQPIEVWLGHEPVENELLGFPPHQGLRVSGGIVWVPHWLTVIVAAVTAASLWIRRRFSLRTLLIAITLVAVLMGAIVYASR